jgi:hypothetical protein
MAEGIRWTRKTREFHSHHFDSTIGNDSPAHHERDTP